MSICDFDGLVAARVLTGAGGVHGATFQKAKRAKYADIINRIEATIVAVRNEAAVKALNRTGAAIYELYNLYRRAHDHLKYRRGVVSFADLAKGSQRLFLGEAGLGARYMLARGVEHFLLDEFQDTSRLQWGVFSELVGELISGASVHDQAPIAPTLFLVGDVKQSIYGFREADPGVMVEAITGLRDRVLVAPLNESYRTAQVVLDYINQVFRAGKLVDFTDHRTARVATAGGNTTGGNTAGTPVVPNVGRVLVTPTFIAPTGEEARLEEAHYLADYLTRALSEPQSHPVYDKITKTMRPLRPADCVVLYRTGTYADAFEAALRSAGLHVEREESKGYFARQEIKDLRALLQYLAFPTDSTALCHFLQSPFGGQSDHVIFEILAATRHDSPVDRSAMALQLLARHDPSLAAILTALLDKVDYCLPHQLLGEIYGELGALGLVNKGWFPTAEEGDLARRNLLRLVELCMGAEADGALSLTAVIAQLNYLADADEEGNAAGSTTGVTMMTIHKSKGLEFPLVCLVDCGRPWAKTDPYWAKVSGTESGLEPSGLDTSKTSEASSLLDDITDRSEVTGRQSEPGIAYIGRKGLQPCKDLAFDALKKTAEAQQTSETERVLYVALTRAKQYLVISGHRGDVQVGKGLTTTVVGERLFRAAREVELSQGQDCWGLERRLRAGLEGAEGISTVPPAEVSLGDLAQASSLTTNPVQEFAPNDQGLRESYLSEPTKALQTNCGADLDYELILAPDNSLPAETMLLAPSGRNGDLPKLTSDDLTSTDLIGDRFKPDRYEPQSFSLQDHGFDGTQLDYLRELSGAAIKLLLPDGKTARDLAIARGLFVHEALECWIKDAPFAQDNSWQAAKAAAGVGLNCDPIAEREALRGSLSEVDSVKVSSVFAELRKGAEELLAETQVVHRRGGRLVNGTIDLIVVRSSSVAVVDYKTTPFASLGHDVDKVLTDAARRGLQQFCLDRGYTSQMKLYREAVQEIFPNRSVTSLIYFTAVDLLLDC